MNRRRLALSFLLGMLAMIAWAVAGNACTVCDFKPNGTPICRPEANGYNNCIHSAEFCDLWDPCLP